MTSPVSSSSMTEMLLYRGWRNSYRWVGRPRNSQEIPAAAAGIVTPSQPHTEDKSRIARTSGTGRSIRWDGASGPMFAGSVSSTHSSSPLPERTAICSRAIQQSRERGAKRRAPVDARVATTTSEILNEPTGCGDWSDIDQVLIFALRVWGLSFNTRQLSPSRRWQNSARRQAKRADPPRTVRSAAGVGARVGVTPVHRGCNSLPTATPSGPVCPLPVVVEVLEVCTDLLNSESPAQTCFALHPNPGGYE